MASESQIIAQLRFALDQLSARNGHHEFERLCRHTARRTICSNILPATGPVAAGGDQARDFETYRTYLSESALHDSAFIGRSSSGPIAFVCTIQRDKIPQKIRSDVETVLAGPGRPEAVHVFLAHDLPVSRRHQLQKWAHDVHAVHLDILDGQAIAEILCDPEHFWIAEEFLSVPREFRPQRDSEKVVDWYLGALARWTPEAAFAATPANFHELASAIRHATFTSAATSDLPLWIRRLETLRQLHDCPEHLASRATYEIAVASLRGIGTLHGREVELRHYFTRVPTLAVPAEFEDTIVLLTYCRGAYARDNLAMRAEELDTIRDQVVSRLDACLSVTETATTRCALLELRGYCAFVFSGSALQPEPPDVPSTFRWWTEMLDLVSGAPTYPLEQFADRLTDLIRLIGYAPGYDKMARRVDKLLSYRSSGFIAATKCRDRAIEFRKRNQIMRAINELHRAKIGWFADETLRGAFLAMLLLAEWYRDLHLVFAAKQYAFAVAYMAINTIRTDLKVYAPQALLAAADCEYAQGHWCEFFGRIQLMLSARNLVPNQDHTEERDEDQLRRIVFHTSYVLAMSKRFVPSAHESIVNVVNEWGLNDYFDDATAIVDEVWNEWETAKIWETFEEQLEGRPFGDAGDVRVSTWRQLGLLWRVSYQNRPHVCAMAEEFMATAQILMAEWTSLDLCLLSTTVVVEIQVEDTCVKPELAARASNEGRSWLLRLPAQRADVTGEQIQQETLALALVILEEVSLLPQGKMWKRIERTFKDGIAAKVIVARPFHELYIALTPDPGPFAQVRMQWVLPKNDRDFAPHEHPEMGWFAGPGPGYNVASSRKAIRNRYRRGMRPIRITIKRLGKDADFVELVARLRVEGWRDWHLVLAVTNIVLNYRVFQPALRRRLPQQEIRERVAHALKTDETFQDIWVPNSSFSEDAIRHALVVSQLSTIQSLKLECRQSTPDTTAIAKFLGDRYGYWTDDVEHESLFA